MPRQHPLFTGYRAGKKGAIAALLIAAVGAAQAAEPRGLVRALADAPPAEQVCPHLVLIGELDPGLRDVEKRLLCGDPTTDAWKKIPATQVKYQLKVFLQDRAYFHSQFRMEPGEKVVVDLGRPTLVTQVTADGAPPEFDITRRRKIVGSPMTPDLLGTLEKWVSQQLERIGFACPDVRAQADPETGAVNVQIRTGPKQFFTGLTDEMAPGLLPNVLRRFDAFRIGSAFDSSDLSLTSNRITDAQLYQSATFTWECKPEGVVLKQSVVEGPPRLLSFGFGANTEGILIGKASWRNSRLGLKASSADVTLYVSAIEQRLTSFLQAYVFDPGSRQSIRPTLELSRTKENFYTANRAMFQLAHQTSWDLDDSGGTLRTGPMFEFIRTVRGTGAPSARLLELSIEAEQMTHDFEYYHKIASPGHLVALQMTLATRDIFSSVTAQRLNLRGEQIWNYRNYEPWLWMFGLRGGAEFTFSPERLSDLPVTFLHFLGGSKNLRGFGRSELPVDGAGRLSSAFLGAELRLGEVLPFSIEPLLFTDVGALGSKQLAFEPPIYWSPGFGLRWAPVFGVFRATLAHGYPADAPGHFQVYVSFGEDF